MEQTGLIDMGYRTVYQCAEERDGEGLQERRAGKHEYWAGSTVSGF